MPILPVFHDEPITSLRAVMAFPNDMQKAASYAAWMLAKGSKGRSRDVQTIGVERLHSITIAMLDHPEAEVKARIVGGCAAGEVTKVLFALINDDPAAASWNNAIQWTATHGARTRGRNQMAVSPASLRSEMAEFAPVLHLWGAWAIRGRRRRDDASVGYSLPDDVNMFLCEAEILLRELRKWNEGKSENARSRYLEANAFQVDPCWKPPRPRAGWPRTGIIPALKLQADAVRDPPPLRRPGRPRKNPV